MSDKKKIKALEKETHILKGCIHAQQELIKQIGLDLGYAQKRLTKLEIGEPGLNLDEAQEKVEV